MSMKTTNNATNPYQSYNRQSGYGEHADRIRAMHQKMQEHLKSSFHSWQTSAQGASNGELAQGGSKDHLADFLSMVEDHLGETQSTETDGGNGTRAGNPNVIVSDQGRLFQNGGYKDEPEFDNHARAYNNASVVGSKGNDHIEAYDNSMIMSGRGDDYVHAYNNAQIATGQGNDEIRVYDNAIIDAGGGHDSVIAYNNATINLGAGHDYAYAGGDNNIIDGGAGDDIITGGNNAILFGGEGNDHIGSRNNALIDGGTGDDHIFTLNNSIVQGGTGNDYIRMGDNTNILFNKGDGWDVIEAQPESSLSSGQLTQNTIQFGPDISLADLDFVRRGPHLVINIKNTDDALVIRNVDKNKTPEIALNDSAPLTDTDIAAMTRIDDSPLEERLKTAGNKKLVGTDGDDNLSNLMHAEVWAGAGNDHITVASESTVHFGRGNGQDSLRGALSWHLDDISKAVNINEIDLTAPREKAGFSPYKASGTLDTSRVLFDEDITPDDVSLSFDGNNLIIKIKGTEDTLTIPDMGRVEDNSHIRPNQFTPNLEFADGTYWVSSEVAEKADAAS